MKLIKSIALLFSLILCIEASTQTFYITKTPSSLNSSKLIQNGNNMMIYSGTTVPAILQNVRLTIDGSDLTSTPALSVLSGNTIGLQVSTGISAYTIRSTSSINGMFMTLEGYSSMGYSLATNGPIVIGTGKSSVFNGEVDFLSDASFQTINIGETEHPGYFKSKSTDFCTFSALQDKGNGIFIDKPILKYTSSVIETLALLKVKEGFQIESGAGKNKVLLSDEVGIATWSDISSLNLNYWMKNENNDIYVIDEKVGIGIIPPDESPYKLFVTGGILTEEVKVQLKGGPDWPDYVFSSNYKLNSLSDVEAFISKNNHLPDLPSAEKVREEGINLGEMNALLLKKIEELTLYVIELEKKYEKLERIQLTH